MLKPVAIPGPVSYTHLDVYKRQLYNIPTIVITRSKLHILNNSEYGNPVSRYTLS